jgi:hypothetical protein
MVAVFGCERVVGESMGPMVDVGAYVSPQAVSNSINRKRNAKPNHKPDVDRNLKGDHKGTPLLCTNFVIAMYLLSSEGFSNFEHVIEITPVIASLW